MRLSAASAPLSSSRCSAHEYYILFKSYPAFKALQNESEHRLEFARSTWTRPWK